MIIIALPRSEVTAAGGKKGEHVEDKMGRIGVYLKNKLYDSQLGEGDTG
jgi:hypothetical protein